MTAVDGVFTGTSGNDQLVISEDTTYLTHNRFDLGDAGFESGRDFDSVAHGVQERFVNQDGAFALNASDGDDSLVLVGNVASSVVGGLDMGPGIDTVDASGMARLVRIGTSATQHMETVEFVIGTNYADTINGLANGASRANKLSVFGGAGADDIKGSYGPDLLDGGSGTNRISGFDGNDVLRIALPLPVVWRDLDGGLGTDALVVAGTDAADEIGLFDGVLVDGQSADGGYRVGAERAQFNLRGGDDFALVSTPLSLVKVFGGPGNDLVVADAHKATVKLESSDAGPRFTIPLSSGVNAPKSAVVAFGNDVEQYAPLNETTIGTAPGPGGGPHVRTFRADGSPVASFYAYNAGFTGGVTLAMGDLDGDFDDEIVTGAGPGGGPHVRVFYSDGSDTGVSFFAYDAGFNGGVSLATVDINGDGIDELVTAPASGGSPHVRVWTGDGQLVGEWMAAGFGNSGLRVARGREQSSKYGGETILLSSAAGEPHQVRAFDADGEPAAWFVAYSPYGSFGGGATVSRGQFRNTDVAHGQDLWDEVITGAGPGGGPLVVVGEHALGSGQHTTLGAFYAYKSSFTGGVEVAACNADGGPDEVVTVPGRGIAPAVRTFAVDGTVKRKSFLAYDAGFINGIRVVCGGTLSRAFSNQTGILPRTGARLPDRLASATTEVAERSH